MAKINLPPVEQLKIIKKRCEEIEQKYPKRKAAYKPSFTNFDKELRDGIVFYSSGWGWRLRKNWRETWQQRYDEKIAATDDDDDYSHYLPNEPYTQQVL